MTCRRVVGRVEPSWRGGYETGRIPKLAACSKSSHTGVAIWNLGAIGREEEKKLLLLISIGCRRFGGTSTWQRNP
jgi:hypothetical protein